MECSDDIVLAATADAVLDELAALHSEAATRRTAASLAAAGLFGTAAMPEVGGDVWRALWEAARRYSVEVTSPMADFPPPSPGMLCVLCHQPLSEEATRRMQRFAEFVQGDTERLTACSCWVRPNPSRVRCRSSGWSISKIDMLATSSSVQPSTVIQAGLEDSK